MIVALPPGGAMAPDARSFYRHAIACLLAARIPFLVGGAFAFQQYTGITRHTKDFDIFLRERDCHRALAVLGEAGFHTALPFTHWLAKAYCGEHFVDLIFSSGNGVASVDDEWFAHAQAAVVLGQPVQLCPPEEIIWQKSLVMERERYDGADVAHLLRARAETLDWPRLLRRFDGHWRVLLSHLILFGYIYPGERDRIPAHVTRHLTGTLAAELATPAPRTRLCRGPVLSREQYLPDLERWGYADARLAPHGGMSRAEIAEWTEAIESEP